MCKKITRLDVKFYQDPGFQKLEEEWYGRLKADGFQDAEKKLGTDSILVCTQARANWGSDSGHWLINMPGAWGLSYVKESSQQYYNILSEWLHEDVFESEFDRIIMTRIADGAKIKDISDELKKLGHRWHRQTIRFRIRKYEHKLGIRAWAEQELNPPWKNGKKKVPTQ